MKMKYRVLPYDKLNELLSELSREYRVVAPIEKQGVTVFDEVNDPSEIKLDGYTNTLYPLKKIFLPYREVLREYDDGNLRVEYKTGKTLLFGVRPCDVHGLLVLDKLLLDEPVDPYYKARRENTLVMVLNCSEPCLSGFCESLDTDKVAEGYDLLLTESDNGYIVEAESDDGKKLLAKKYFREDKAKPKEKKPCKKKLDNNALDKLDGESFNHPVWKENADECLSCTACTMTCPTCNCFDVRDEVEFNMNEGRVYRLEDSCQLRRFTRVAGGYVFRSDRVNRLRHRVYHKLDYFKKQFGIQMCVGCGRCITNCPTDIDMVEMVNQL